MSTKLNPGAYDCHANAEPDEEMFILLARDVHAPATVRHWADLREARGGKPEKVAEARACADRMDAWHHAKIIAKAEDQAKTEAVLARFNAPVAADGINTDPGPDASPIARADFILAHPDQLVDTHGYHSVIAGLRKLLDETTKAKDIPTDPMTPGEARSRIAALRADRAWTAAYVNGDGAKQAEMSRLHRLAFPGASA